MLKWKDVLLRKNSRPDRGIIERNENYVCAYNTIYTN